MRRRIHLVFLSIPILLGGLSSSTARTWYVAADGSGDAPTIAAAVDSTLSGDVILVGPGTHTVVSAVDGGVNLHPNTSLVSEFGPTATFLVALAGPLQPGLVGAVSNCIITGFTMEGGQNSTISCNGNNYEVFNNIVHGRIQLLGTGRIHHNIVDTELFSIYVVSPSGIQIQNNIVIGEIRNNYSGGCYIDVLVTCNLIQGGHDCFLTYGNFNADPLFCGVENYYLHADSPCAPGNHPDGFDCGLIGPLPVGCGTVSTVETTWGAVKALYRD